MDFDATIIGIPRSRTFWFSKLLTIGGLHCYHDFHSYLYGPVKATRLMNSSCSPWFRHTGRKVIIHRPRAEAEASFLAYSQAASPEQVARAFDLAEQHLHTWDGLHVDYRDIDERLDEILTYIKVVLPRERILEFRSLNLQSTDNGSGISPEYAL